MGLLLIFVAIFILLDSVAILFGLNGVHRWLVWRDLKHREAVREEVQQPRGGIAERQPHLAEMGDPTGKTLREIIECVGRPNSYSKVGRNLVVQWSQPGATSRFFLNTSRQEASQ